MATIVYILLFCTPIFRNIWQQRRGQSQKCLQIGKLWRVPKRAMLVLKCCQLCFSRNVAIFGIYMQNTTFWKWSKNNIISLNNLIFLDTWTKTQPLKENLRRVPLAWILIFSQIWAKNDFYKVISKMFFSLKCW